MAASSELDCGPKMILPPKEVNWENKVAAVLGSSLVSKTARRNLYGKPICRNSSLASSIAISMAAFDVTPRVDQLPLIDRRAAISMVASSGIGSGSSVFLQPQTNGIRKMNKVNSRLVCFVCFIIDWLNGEGNIVNIAVHLRSSTSISSQMKLIE